MSDSSAANHRPLRILMTADAVGGVWQYTVDLVGGLSQSGYRVLVAVLGPWPSSEQKAQLLNFTGVEVVAKNLAVEWESNPWADVDASGQWLMELDCEFHADLVHLNGYSHANLSWKKPVVVVAHSCVFSWWRHVIETVPDSEWMEYKRRVTSGLLACDIVVAPSRFMVSEIQREYGVSPRKTRVIYNFTATEMPDAEEKQPFALAAGRVWDRAKNFSLLEEIAPHVSWPICLAGDNKDATTQTAVQFLGRLSYSDLLSQMNQASIFVHPALYEPFGLSVLEAARSSCCLLLADTDSMRELWGDAAIFANPRRPGDWIRQLNRLADDSATRQELGQQAYLHSQRYRKDCSVTEYRELYSLLTAVGGREAEDAA